MALFSKKYLAVPTELTFHPKSHSDDVILNKQTVKIDPYTSKTLFSPGDDIQIKITGDKAVDLRTIVLNFTCYMVNNEGKSIRDDVNAFATSTDIFRGSSDCVTDLKRRQVVHLHSWIGSIFKTFNLRLNDTVQIENIDHYNRLRHTLAKMTVNEGYRNSQYGHMEGWHYDCKEPIANLGVGLPLKTGTTAYCLRNGRELADKIITDLGPAPSQTPKWIETIDQKDAPTQTILTTSLKITKAGTSDLNPAVTIPVGTVIRVSSDGDKLITIVSVGSATTSEIDYVITNSDTAATTADPILDLKFDEVGGFRENDDLVTIRNISYFDRYMAGVIEREYSIRLDLSGLLGRVPKILYLPTVGSLDMYMRLEDAGKVINLDDQSAGAVSYRVKDIHVQAEYFDLSQAYLNSLKTVLDDQGMVLELDTYLTYEFPLDTSSTQTIRLWRRLVSLKGLYFGIYRENKDLTYERKKTDILSRYDHAGLKEYQLYIDGRPIQAHPIKTEVLFEEPDVNGHKQHGFASKVLNSEAEWEIMKALRYHGDIRTAPFYDRDQKDNTNNQSWRAVRNYDSSGADDDYFQKKTELVYNNKDFRATPFALYAVDLEKSDLLSGTSLSNELALQLRFNTDDRLTSTIQADSPTGDTALNFNYRLFMFLHYDKRVIVHSGLRITEIE